jgi:hypothetical protein
MVVTLERAGFIKRQPRVGPQHRSALGSKTTARAALTRIQPVKITVPRY